MRINIYHITLIFLVLISFLNFGAIWIGVFGGNIPLNPIIYLLCFAILLFNLKKRALYEYFLIANILFLVFFLLGFWGNHNYLDYRVLQSIFKFWIVIIGLPFLFLRSFNPTTLSSYLNLVIFLAAINSIIIVHQFIDLQFWAPILAGGEEHAQRPAGLWVNPNTAGLLLISSYVFSYYKFIDNPKFLSIYRLMIIIGIVFVMSRTIIVTFILIEIYRQILYKNFKTFSYSVAAVLLILAVTFFVVEDFEAFNRFSDAHPTASDFEKSRGKIFILALMQIENDWFFGLGHTAMNEIVPIGGGLGPHNFYVWILGTAGVLSLLAFIIWMYRFLLIGIRSSDKNIKFIFVSFFIILSIVSFTSHDFLLIQPVGVIISILVAIEWMEKNNQLSLSDQLCVE